MFDADESNIILVYAAYALVCVAFLFFSKRVSIYRESIFLMVYLLFGAVSMLWAENSGAAFTKVRTILLLLVLLILVTTYIVKLGKPIYVMAAISIGSLALAVYMVAQYGFSGIFEAFEETEERVGDLINNVNAIANSLVVGLLAMIGMAFLYRKIWLVIPIAFTSICLFAAGSRTATISLIAGLVILILFWLRSMKSSMGRLAGTISVIVAAVAIFFLIRDLPAFQTLTMRMENIFSFFTGEAKVIKENSTEVRMDYIRLGWEQFLKTPIFGNGIGCAGYAMEETYNRVTYLHNNYIEILASGGIIGFILFYAPYAIALVSLLKRVFKDRDRTPVVVITLVLLITRLIGHLGIVLYYSKIEYLFIALLICVVNTPTKKEEPVELPENKYGANKYGA
ncbi:MAG: O-antigen ligase family protein [Clostridia bacterium]|nr:O-antigen ligase family protein [Clostridia bacterium]